MRTLSKQFFLSAVFVFALTITAFGQDPGKNGKRNSRPQQAAAERVDPKPGELGGPTYRYEFSQPDFVVSHIVIEHGADGTGTITFDRKDYEEEITDPLVLSSATIKAIDEALIELNYLDSQEEYQYSKDYSHLGQMTFTLTDGERSRTVNYNWTDNKGAKALAGEYRKIANQYIWMFDINLARENQPLESPRIVSRLDSFLRREEISDPPNMLPFLRGLTADERMPLIARNHILRLIDKIEKGKK